MTRSEDIEALLKVELKQLEIFDTPLRVEANKIVEDYYNKRISIKELWESLPPPSPEAWTHPSTTNNPAMGPTGWIYPFIESYKLENFYRCLVNPNSDLRSVDQSNMEWVWKTIYSKDNSEKGKIRKQIVEKIENLRKEHFEAKKREEERWRNYSPPSFSIDEYIERKIDERIRARTYREEW